MARVDALFVSWACTSLIAGIALTAAACGASQGGAAREDVRGPSLPRRRRRPREPRRQTTPLLPVLPMAAGICVRGRSTDPPRAQPSRQTTPRLPPRPPRPHGGNRAGKRPPARRHARPGPHGRNRAGKRPPPSATPARPPRAQPSRQTTPRPPPRLPRRHQRPGRTSPRAHAGPARPLRQTPDDESESPSDWASLDDVSRSAQGAEYTWQDGRHTRRAPTCRSISWRRPRRRPDPTTSW